MGLEGLHAAFSREHIDMLRHMLRQIEPVFQPLDFLHRLCEHLQQLDVCDAVQPVIRHVLVLVIITDRIIASVCRRDLIGIDNIFADISRVFPSRMQLLVDTAAVVGKRNLAALADRFIHYLDGVKKLLAVQGQIRHGLNVLDPRLKILV